MTELVNSHSISKRSKFALLNELVNIDLPVVVALSNELVNAPSISKRTKFALVTELVNIVPPVVVDFYSLILFSWASKIESKADKNTKPPKKNKESNGKI